MMREIKLRAWDKEKKGFSYVQISANYISMPTDIESNHIQTDQEWPQIALVRFDNVIDWQQYTNHKDKNLKEIYGGDIVEFEYEDDLHNGKFQGSIEWNNDGFWQVMIENHGFSTGIFSQKISDIKVIGNIHEHPHLLEVK